MNLRGSSSNPPFAGGAPEAGHVLEERALGWAKVELAVVEARADLKRRACRWIRQRLRRLFGAAMNALAKPKR